LRLFELFTQKKNLGMVRKILAKNLGMVLFYSLQKSWNGAIMKRKVENDVVYLPLYMAGML